MIFFRVLIFIDESIWGSSNIVEDVWVECVWVWRVFVYIVCKKVILSEGECVYCVGILGMNLYSIGEEWCCFDFIDFISVVWGFE